MSKGEWEFDPKPVRRGSRTHGSILIYHWSRDNRPQTWLYLKEVNEQTIAWGQVLQYDSGERLGVVE